jgi:hypothetical protein
MWVTGELKASAGFECRLELGDGHFSELVYISSLVARLMIGWPLRFDEFLLTSNWPANASVNLSLVVWWPWDSYSVNTCHYVYVQVDEVSTEATPCT